MKMPLMSAAFSVGLFLVVKINSLDSVVSGVKYLYQFPFEELAAINDLLLHNYAIEPALV